jgi:hypothetical protein
MPYFTAAHESHALGYDRALPGGLVATPVIEVTLLAGFVDALRELNVTLIATP